ncbi:MAG TPA: hypothetical protein VGX37_05950 [Allosphingosinicella sp.]|nr:hypothetical protein [Allosphingosinicella sp.]
MDATPTLQSPATTEELPSASALEAELSEFGRWLVRAGEIQAPLNAALAGLQAQSRAAGRSGEGAARFRQAIADILTLAERTDAQLAALETPTFASLDLPADLQPVAIVQNMRQLNAQSREVALSFTPLLEAMARNDLAAVRQASRRLMGSLQLLVQAQLLMTRASLAATPRDTSGWDAINVQVLFFRSAERILNAWPSNGIIGTDQSLASDLRDLAAELDEAARAGTTKLATELEVHGAELAAAENEGDEARISIFRRTRALLLVDGEMFPLANDLAGILRRHAGELTGGQVPAQSIARIFQQLQPIRQRMDQINLRESAALAGGE